MTTTPEELEAPGLHLYLDEPQYAADQDDETADVLVLARTLVLPTAPRTYEETLAWCADQSAHRSQDWTGQCQKFCRSAPGCPGGAASALDAWFGMPDGARVVGGSPEDAEPGWQLFSRSRDPDALSSQFGHVIQVGRDFAGGQQSAWSTDALRLGWPDRINPADLYAKWDHEYLGKGRWQNGLWLDVKDPRPPKPVPVPYQRLGAAVVDADRVLHKLRKARDTAKDQHDWKDRDAIEDLIHRQMVTKAEIRAAYDKLRRLP